jgi:hypothetical protein
MDSLVEVGCGEGDVKVCDRSLTQSSGESEVEEQLVEVAQCKLFFACDWDLRYLH